MFMLICLGFACIACFKLCMILVAWGSLPGAEYATLTVIDHHSEEVTLRRGGRDTHFFLIVEQENQPTHPVRVPKSVFHQYSNGHSLPVVYLPFHEAPIAIEGQENKLQTLIWYIGVILIMFLGVAYCIVRIRVIRNNRATTSKQHKESAIGKRGQT